MKLNIHKEKPEATRISLFFFQERALVLYPELVQPGGELRLRGGGREDRKVTWF